MNRRHNFNPGPAALPLEVLTQAREEAVEYGNRGMSLMEMSHRSPEVERMVEETRELLLGLLGLDDRYEALFMAGGASAQFGFIPMNLASAEAPGNYVLSGSFAEKAYLEAMRAGAAVAAASSKQTGWRAIPKLADIQLAEHAAYLHMTTNNTIEGTQLRELPDVSANVPLIGDMTSDILSRPFDYARFGLIYASAQKNLGPAGVTAVIIRRDLIERSAKADIPHIFRYDTFAQHDSLYNTPPVHAIWMMKLMLEWTRNQGSSEVLGERNARKACLLYDAIDASGGFYEGIAAAENRSMMNITWKLTDERLEASFLAQAEKNGFEGLAGHRSVGGLRASIYNAVPEESCAALASFLREFVRNHG
ncbi:3-phosphoserine/phosphohydroxythreonine transaminase [Paenibacillus methanolicus]|uniref:Phosphoserine aminotransferase n=1 Tax=Paenibacillus methanolicus TaxID=582686 RepID=A0A5S5CI23_9BACL|nr:3-phosphoserine/phosphohydroxythreonine transaminase [Paenibacillus methanolicus]TYP79446.1 phosphoserine aminotransferase [Paenibacillus methanolicus]